MLLRKVTKSASKLSLSIVLVLSFLILAPASALAAQAQVAPLIPVYRLFSPALGDHFYTISAVERDFARNVCGYSLEGPACTLNYDSNKNTADLYRLFSPTLGDHFYTTSPGERAFARDVCGYVDEGVAYRVSSSNVNGALPVYRLFSPKLGDHFYTTNPVERDFARDACGYNYEGIAYYVPTITAADEVSTLISDIPILSNISLAESAQVGLARLAYDALAVSQKPDVSNYAVLLAAEAQLNALTAATDALVTAENDPTQENIDAALALMPPVAAGNAKTGLQARIDTVQTNMDAAASAIALIDDLPTPANLVLSDQSQVTAARTAYDALTTAQKALVTNYATLTAGEYQLNALDLANYAVSLAETSLTQDSIDTAQNNIDDCVSGAAKTALQNRLNAVQDIVSANAVIALINALPPVSNLTLSDATQVATARVAYNNLSGPQQAFVSNYSALTAAENQITAIASATTAVENAELLQTQGSVNTANGVMGFVASGAAKTSLQARLDSVQQHINDHTAAAAVDALIDALPTPATIVLSDGTQINTAWNAYWLLTEDQMDLVVGYTTLESAYNQYGYLVWASDEVGIAEGDPTQSNVDTANVAIGHLVDGAAKTALQARINAVQAHINDHTAAAAVDSQIAAIPSLYDLDLGDSTQVSEARTAYDGLTAGQKALVINYDTLYSAESQIAALDAATDAVDSADLLGTQDSVDSANGYMGMVADGYAKQALQTRLDAVQTYINNHIAAAAVELLISALPTPANLVLSDYSLISPAWIAYWSLTTEQMSLVSNYSTLAAAWNQYWYLKWATEDVFNAEYYLTQSAIDYANNSLLVVAAGDAKTALINRLDAVQDIVDATAAVVTAEATYLPADIIAARLLVNALPDGAAKTDLSNRLDTVESGYDQHQADDVISLINNLPSIYDLDLDDSTQVSEARTAYDGLTADQKDLVDNYSTLTDAEAQITALELATAAVEGAELSEMQEAVNEANAAIAAAADGYAKTALQDRIDVVQTHINDHTAAAAVYDMIAALPVPGDVNLNHGDAINAALEAYDALSADQQALVTNYSRLQDADTAYYSLLYATNLVIYAEANPYQFYVDDAWWYTNNLTPGAARNALFDRIAAVQQYIDDQAAADYVIGLINALPPTGDLDLYDESDVDYARSEYDLLTEDQVALVTNYLTLTAAEDRIVEMWLQVNDVKNMIDGLPAPTDVVLSDETRITAAWDTYWALAPANAYYVDNYSYLEDVHNQLQDLGLATAMVINAELYPTQFFVDQARWSLDYVVAGPAKTDLENRLNAVQTHINDHTAAAVVEALIAHLPLTADVVLSDEIEISVARAAYDLLTANQKVLVPNYLRLTNAEHQLGALDYASDEIDILAEAALTDMLVEANINAAEAALSDANAAMSDVAAGTPKSLLQARIDAVSGGIAQARTRFDALEKINAGTESFDDYGDAGIVNAVSGNHAAYHDAVAAAKLALHRSLILSEVQTQINRVNLFAAAKSAVAAAEVSQTQGDVDSARGLVSALPNGSTKNSLNARLNAVQLNIDAAEADRVMSMISALGPVEDLVYGDLYDVDMALAAYNALTLSQKVLVIGEELWHLDAAVIQINLIATATETLDDLEYLLDNEDMSSLSNIEQAEDYCETIENALSPMTIGGEYNTLCARLNDPYSATQTARNRYDALARINAGTEIMEDFDTAGVVGIIWGDEHKAAYDGAVESAILALGRDLTLAEVQEQVDLANVAPRPGSMTITTNERPGGITMAGPAEIEGEWWYVFADDFSGTESITGMTIELTGSNYLDLGSDDTPVIIDGEPAGYFDYSGSGNVWEYHGIGGTYSAGWHYLNATFTDRAGNPAYVRINFEVVAPPPVLSCFYVYGSGGYSAHSHSTDGLFPSIDFYSGQEITGSTMLAVSDAIGMNTDPVTIYVDGEPSGHSFTWGGGGWWIISGTPWVLPTGSHTMTATFTNTRGGTVTATVPFTVSPT